MKAGFTLIEAMVSIAVFAVLATVASALLLGVLRGTLKAAATNQVRTEGAFAMETMARSIRFAPQIISCTGNSIEFRARASDLDAIVYTCSGDYVASNSARLTSPKVVVTNCNISCFPDGVNIGLTLEPKGGGAIGLLGARLVIDSTIVTRNISD